MTPRSRLKGTPLLVVMGVSGCGKSTIGRKLAERFSVPFIDGDDLHPPANIEKMASGVPLTGEDRRPWLVEIGRTLRRHDAEGVVIACSALRLIYRNIIREEAPSTYFVHLDVPREVLEERLASRTDHFMPLSLLDDQLRTLEPLRSHEQGAALRANREPDRLVREAVQRWRNRKEFVQ